MNKPPSVNHKNIVGKQKAPAKRAYAKGAAMILSAIAIAAPGKATAPSVPPLIPRQILFGNPEKTFPQISPDGKRLAWLAPDPKNILQVWLKTIGQSDDKIITADKHRGVRSYFWAEDNQTLLYEQDSDGDENWHIFGVDLKSGNIRDYTPFQGVRAEVLAVEQEFPDEILINLNLRDRSLMDVHRLNLRTGAIVLDTENPGDVQSFVADSRFQVRGAAVALPDGGTELRVRDTLQSPWRSWLKAGPDDTLTFGAFLADGNSAVISSSLNNDTSRLIEKEVASGNERVIASSSVDVSDVVVERKTKRIQAVAFEYGRLEWTVIDPSLKADFEHIQKIDEGDFSIANRNDDETLWVVRFTQDRGPLKFYLWDHSAQKGTFLFSHQPKLEGQPLAEMEPVVIKTRDGLKLESYLTLPKGVAPKKLPLVLLVHGGPWGRDSWGYRSSVQWLANRGYACLQVNFRGSAGFGKKFLNAGNREWGLKMHDDLLDAVDWAVKKGYADPKRVAIMGGSYGGYATLAGLAFTPEKFACGVDIVGPSNIKTLLSTIPPYWKPIKAMFNHRIGNIDDPKDAELIKNASPLFKADKIVRPLLIGQGANDPRVKQAESEQIVAAIEKNKGKVTYVIYTDEGHGFARPENSIDFFARAETFLAGCLGGRSEPMIGDRVEGSTAVVKVIEPK